ncbi:hypothetical protein JTB14_014471 [Gonioctena quinquepunctata]|nr:hypothetical protein JTB14_014471 [Gonioctena quinquepunctata]
MGDSADINPEHRDLFELLLKANQIQTNQLQTEFKQTIDHLTNELGQAQKEIDCLKEKCSFLERKVKSNNIVIFGIEMRENENLCNKTLSVINENFGLNLNQDHLNDVYKLGKGKNARVLLEFVSHLNKRKLFQNPQNLGNFREKGLSISDDLSKDDREELNVLKYHLKIARSQNHVAKIRGLKLFINDKSYTADKLRKLVNNQEISAEEENSEDIQEVSSNLARNTQISQTTTKNSKPPKVLTDSSRFTKKVEKVPITLDVVKKRVGEKKKQLVKLK